MAENENKTQCEIILRHLEDFGSITTYHAFTEYGITRLASRMYELKQAGYLFESSWVQKTNRYGDIVKFKKYTPKKACNN